MEKRLIIEDINRMRTIMGLDSILTKDDITKITKSMTNLVSLNESLLTESVGKGILNVLETLLSQKKIPGIQALDGIVKSLDDFNIKISKGPKMVNLITDLETVLKGMEVSPSTSSETFLSMLKNRKLSKAMSDSWGDFVDNLDSTIKDQELTFSFADRMDVGEYLYKVQDDIRKSYEDIEDYIAGVINNPIKGDTGADLVKRIEQEIGDGGLGSLKNAEGENIFYKNIEDIYDDGVKNLKGKTSTKEGSKLVSDLLEDIKLNGFSKTSAALKKLFKWIGRTLKDIITEVWSTARRRIQNGFTKIDAKYATKPFLNKSAKTMRFVGEVSLAIAKMFWTSFGGFMRQVVGFFFKGIRDIPTNNSTLLKIKKGAGATLEFIIATALELSYLFHNPEQLGNAMTFVEAFTGANNLLYYPRKTLDLLASGPQGIFAFIGRTFDPEGYNQNQKDAAKAVEEFAIAKEAFLDSFDPIGNTTDIYKKMKAAKDCLESKMGVDVPEGKKLDAGKEMKNLQSEFVKTLVEKIEAGDVDGAKEVMKNEFLAWKNIQEDGLSSLNASLDEVLSLCKEMKVLEVIVDEQLGPQL